MSNGATETAPSTENWFLTWLKRRWLAVVLVLLVVIVAIQNGLATETATIQLLWATVSMPVWLLVGLLFLIGAIAGWLFAHNRAARRSRR